MFNELKDAILNAPVLAFFDSNKKSVISVDSSRYGLDVVMLQNNHPVTYASAALNETQQRYSQTEKELLTILNGYKNFHYYVYGKKFIVETDHKPLLGFAKETDR